MFIELERTFRRLVDDLTITASDDAELVPSTTKLVWSDILQLYRVVVLSEAGAGKTEEIRHAAQRLREDGKAAYFLRLEHISTSFEAAFEEGTFDEFETWLESSQEGWLLLDSIDEARLRDPLDFESAVRILGYKLRPAMQRVHLILTGRAAAWRPLTDLALCARHLPYSGPSRSALVDESRDEPGSLRRTMVRAADPGQIAFTIVSLEDLSVTQARLFVAEMGVPDVDEFLEAIERADGWSFTTRPLDLQELLEFWQGNKRIGSRRELLKASIDRRLREQDQTRNEQSPLALARVREGARLVAAACTLTLQQTIAVPDRSKSAQGLRLDSLLTGWTAKEHATLLQRAIFDEEIYGTVRFHHRSAREYLTAEWFAELLKQNTSRKAIEGLFFREQYGLEVVPPVLRPVLPWLAVLDLRIQERALLVAPEVLLRDGDPSQLRLSTRRRVLDATCAALSSGAVCQPADYSAVQRFAADDLAEDVKRLLSTHKDEESQVFLLRMVWQGRLTGVLPEAVEAAMSPTVPTYVRKVAIRAARATGTERELDTIRGAFAKEAPVLSREILAELLEAAPRSGSTSAWLCDCLERVEKYRQFSVDYLREGICDFVQQLDPREVAALAERMNRFIEKQPVIERGHCDISTRYAWLLKPAALAVYRLVRERHAAIFSDASLSLLHKLPSAQPYDLLDFDDKLNLKALVQGWPELNFALFWHSIEAARRKVEKKGTRVTDWWQAQIWHSFVALTPADFDAALDCVSSRDLRDDKLVALSLAFRLYVERGRPAALRHRLKAVCKSATPLSERLQTLLHPPRQSPEVAKARRMNDSWDRRSKARSEREDKNREAWRKHLLANVDKVRDPGLRQNGVSEEQHYLYQELRRIEKSVTTWSKSAWHLLEPAFGTDVAQAFRDGAVAYWRRYCPALVSEGAPLNSTPFQVIFGLTGLAIESAETEDWIAGLSDADVEVAFRYAMHELNGYPAWFSSVFRRNPTTVRDLVLTEIDNELSIGVEEQDIHYVIYDVNCYGEWLWDSLAPVLLSRLATVEPKNLRSLQYLLNVIQGSAMADEAIQALAQSRALSSSKLEHCAQWYAVWTGVAPDESLPALIAHVESISADEERVKFVMIVLTQLVGGRRGGASRVRAAYGTARHLKALYLLAHKHVLLREDIDRVGGGVYSPGLRDDAQDAREHLLSLLRALPGKDAFVALSEIAQEHPSQQHRSYIAMLAKAKAESDAAGAPWSEGQIREFNEDQERMPHNHRELFDIAVLRLLDLKEDLEQGDSSDAPMLARVASERDIRTYIGNWLRNLARGRYGVPQEEELADAKRPDLRFHGIAFDAPVPVELKLADNWSGPKLFERLKTQLCHDYLRDRRSTCGVFLLVYRGDQKSWQLPDAAGTVDFDGLVRALQARWVALSPSLPNVEEILVVGVDLTKRTVVLAA